MMTHTRFMYYILTTLTSILLFFSGVVLGYEGLYWAVPIAFGSFVTGLLVEIHYFKIMTNEVTIKGAPARNPEELAWEQLGNALKQVADLETRVSVLEDRVKQSSSRFSNHYMILSLVLSAMGVILTVLALTGHLGALK